MTITLSERPRSTIRRNSTVFIIFLFFSSSLAWGGNDQWTSAGPVGGNVQGFLFHPTNRNVVYATEVDGIYRSLNAGKSWKLLQNFLFPIVRVHPVDFNTLLVVDSNGVFLSRNLGKTFESVPSNLGSLLVQEILSDVQIDPDNPQTIYTVARFSLNFLKSTNGGRTWARKNRGLRHGGFLNPRQIHIDPANSKVVYLSISNNVFKSVDRGESWKVLHRFSSEMHGLVLNAKNPQVLYAMTAEDIFKTTNRGNDWAPTQCDCTSSDFFPQSPAIALDPTNPDILYGIDSRNSGVIKSINGGSSYLKIDVPLLIPPIVVSSRVSNLLLAASPGLLQDFDNGSASELALFEGPGILRSQNGGQSWRNSQKGFSGINPTRVRVGQGGKIFVLGGPIGGSISSIGAFVNIANRWQPLALPKSLFGMNDLRVHPKNKNLVVILGGFDEGGLGVSTDGGTVWTSRNIPAIGATVMALDPQNENVIYLAGSGEKSVMKSSDLGNSFQSFSSGLPTRAIHELVIDPGDSDHLYAGLLQPHGIFVTFNGGSNWIRAKGIPRDTVASIAVHPKDKLIAYAVSSDEFSRLFRTTNGGRTWTRAGNGVPEMASAIVKIDPQDPETIVVAGSRGIFVSTDGGRNFTSFDTNGLSIENFEDARLGSPLFDLAFDQLGSTLHLGANHGVFSLTRSAAPSGPLIQQILPAAGKIGDTVTINGQNFGSTQGNSKVLFGTSPAGTAQEWSPSSIKVRVPAGARTGPVTVTVGSRESNSYEFIVTIGAGELQPDHGSKSGGIKVAFVAPERLTGDTIFSVLFGTTLANDVRFVAGVAGESPDTVVCVAPPGATGTVEVFVVTNAINIRVGTFTYE